MKGIGYYPIKGEKLPSVTAILDYALGFGDGLMDWAVKEGATKLMREMKLAKKEGRRMTIDDAVRIAKSARMDKLVEAQKKGTAVHEWIEVFVKGKEIKDLNFLPSIQKPYIDSFLNWRKDYKFTPILQEQLVFDLSDGFAGRFDYYGKINGELALIDFKTSNYIKPEMGLQLSAYKHCIEQMGMKVDKMYVLHILPRRTELVEFQDDYQTFKNVKQIFDWKVKFAEPEWYPRMKDSDIRKEIKFVTEKTVS